MLISLNLLMTRDFCLFYVFLINQFCNDSLSLNVLLKFCLESLQDNVIDLLKLICSCYDKTIRLALILC